MKRAPVAGRGRGRVPATTAKPRNRLGRCRRPRPRLGCSRNGRRIRGVRSKGAAQRGPDGGHRRARRAALRLRHRRHRQCPALHQGGLRPRQLRPGPGRRRGADRRGRRSGDRRARRRQLRPPADDPALRRRLHRRRAGERRRARARRPRRRPRGDRRRDRARLGGRARLHLRGGAGGEPRPARQLLPAGGDDRDPRRLPGRPRLRRDRRLALDARPRAACRRSGSPSGCCGCRRARAGW